MGRLALGRARRSVGRAAADRRRREAPAAALPVGRASSRTRAGRTDRMLKVTLPSPSLFANFWDPERSTGAYSTLEDFLADVAEILAQEVDELVRLGATLPPARRAAVSAARRSDLARLLREPRLAGRALARARPRARQPRHRGPPAGRDVRLPPLPRQPGEPLARLRRLRVACRARLPAAPAPSACCSSTTTSAPEASSRWRRFREDKVCVLGLVTTKTGRRETVDELEPDQGGRADRAARAAGAVAAVRLRDLRRRQRAHRRRRRRPSSGRSPTPPVRCGADPSDRGQVLH